MRDGFVSSRACLECHPNEYRSWHASYHRTMTQVVDAETAPEAIRDTSATVDGVVYDFDQDGDQFFVSFQDSNSGEEIERRQIVMMTGSHHMHVFWYATANKRTPGQLPIVYLKDERRWIPRRSAFLRPPEFPKGSEFGRWNQTCCKCHSTHPRQRFEPDTETWDTHVAEFGIACEACHGPGEEHVRRHARTSEPSIAVTSEDPIVNPQTLSQQASADVCGRCHSIYMGSFAALSREEYYRSGNPHRPGKLLAQCDFMHIVQASPPRRDSEAFRAWSQENVVTESFWSDGMPRISGREYNGLIESPCFVHGQMTCLSCHTMHASGDQPLEDWRDDQLKPAMRGDQACLQCHTEYAHNVAEHTHHAPGSSGSRCLNCHMPMTTYGLLKTIRSHQISSPNVTTILDTLRPDACTLCHLDRTITWTTGHLHDWFGQPDATFPEDHEAAKTSAAIMHYLRGDAGQRAVLAAAFNWDAAREASGTDWMEPLLLIGCNDPYDAVRIISARAMRSLPLRRSGNLDALAPALQRLANFNAAVQQIEMNLRLDPRPEVLIKADGTFDFLRARILVGQRDDRPVYLRE
jgi:hypothetical protein